MSREAFDTVITGGKVVYPDRIIDANVGIRDGKVAVLSSPSVALQGKRTIDAKGKYLLPGVIDPHGHLVGRRGLAESCRRETPSMVCGGVTSFINFLVCSGSYSELIEQSVRTIEENSIIDIGFHIQIQNELHLRELPDYAKNYGISSFKMFMAAEGRELYPGVYPVDDGLILEAMAAIARLGYPAIAMFHAENWEIGWMLREKLEKEGSVEAAAWTDSRPNVCEEECLRRLFLFALQDRCPVYAVHLTTREAPEILREAKEKGLAFFGETCPHYLMIHKNHPRALWAKYYPAIKAREDNEALWRALKDGTMSSLGSDHIPLKREEKFPGEGNAWTAISGVPGSGTILPILLSEGVNKGRLSLSDVVRVSSYNTARIFGLYPRKGSIAVGSDADIVIVDLEKELILEPEMIRQGFSLFEGWRFKGWPVLTMLCGKVIVREGELLSDFGTGRYLPRKVTN